jgi:hypothetical protein
LLSPPPVEVLVVASKSRVHLLFICLLHVLFCESLIRVIRAPCVDGVGAAPAVPFWLLLSSTTAGTTPHAQHVSAPRCGRDSHSALRTGSLLANTFTCTPLGGRGTEHVCSSLWFPISAVPILLLCAVLLIQMHILSYRGLSAIPLIIGLGFVSASLPILGAHSLK